MRRWGVVRWLTYGMPRLARLTVLGSVATVVAAVLAASVSANASTTASPSRFSLPGHYGRSLPSAHTSPLVSPGHERELSGVTCVSGSDCWAVGDYYNFDTDTDLNVVLHFNGKKWSPVNTPDPGGTDPGDHSALLGLTCVSASDCWAVGYWENSQGADVNQALRFNGKKWSRVRTRDPASNSMGDYNELYGVACTKASDCWAVGHAEARDGASLNEALHWNGKKWSIGKTPQPGGRADEDLSELLGLTCVSASDCWAVGSTQHGSGAAYMNEVLRWGGKKWTVVKAPQPAGRSSSLQPGLAAVTCSKTSDCWAVGTAGHADGTAFRNETFRFNGKKWSRMKSPEPGGTGSGDTNELSAVACLKASDCWAVGYTQHGGISAAYLTQALRFNGNRWSGVKTPNPAGRSHGDASGVFGLACIEASNCWGVGTTGKLTSEELSNLIVRWNGKRWATR